MAANVLVSQQLLNQILSLLAEQPFPLLPITTTPLSSLVASLTRVMWVDGGTTAATADQTGQVSAPFKTITQAVAALPTGGTLLIVPGDYSTEAAVGVGSATTFVNLAGLQYPGIVAIRPVLLPSLTGDGAKNIMGCQLTAAVTSNNTITTQSCNIATNITAVGYQDFHSVITVTNTIQVNGAASDAELRGTRYAIGAGPIPNINLPAARTLRLVDVLFDIAGSVNINFAGAGGLIDADGASFSSFAASAGAIVNGAFQTLWQGWAKVIANVVVPALAATELGYVDVPLAGTILEGTAINSGIIVAPQADLAAAGVGNGFFCNARVSAANTVRLAFVGLLAGGATNFTITGPLNTVS